MNRRRLLKNIMMVSGGLAALPSWAREWSPENLPAGNLFDSVEQNLIKAAADAIIPAGKDPGAITVGTEKFLIRLFEDCYEPDVQENIKAGLSALESKAKNRYQNGFASCTLQQRQDLLLVLAGSENKNDKDFFNLLKTETIRGFSTSKTVMVTYLKYKVVPGHYHGCVNVKA